jgi:hypothetical protein
LETLAFPHGDPALQDNTVQYSQASICICIMQTLDVGGQLAGTRENSLQLLPYSDQVLSTARGL